MSVRTDYLNLVVNVNGNAAKKDYYDLKSRAAELNKELQGLKKGTKEFIDKTKELQDVNARIDSMRGKMDLASLSIKDLRKEIQSMKAVRDSLDPASDAFRNLSERISGAETRLRNLQGTTSLSERAFSFLKREVMAFGMVALGALGLDYLIGKLGNIIQRNAELSDSFADVARYTNLTDDEVKQLSSNLSKIDTRTARKDLLGLAGDAGKLGINGKENIEAFVKSADQIKVALGEDLGKDAIIQLTKLNNVFKVSETYGMNAAQALTHTGSVVNKLGAESAAAEAYLVDFMTRLGPVASQAGLTITQLAGLAATSDELGLSAEVTSTVFNQVLPKMYSDTASYAKVAKMSVADFSALLKKDANAAMIAFLEGLKGNNEGMGEMAQKLKDIEVDGTRGIAVLAALSENTDKLKNSQASANEEFYSGQSIVDEFNKRNSNLAANIEKLKKELASLTATSKLQGFLEDSVSAMLKFIRSIKDTNDESNILKNTIDALKVAWEDTINLYKQIADTLRPISKLIENIGVQLGVMKEDISLLDYILSSLIKGVTQLFKPLTDLLSILETIIRGVNGVIEVFKNLKTIVPNLFSNIKKSVEDAFIPDGDSIFNRIKKALSSPFKKLGAEIKKAFNEGWTGEATPESTTNIPKNKPDQWADENPYGVKENKSVISPTNPNAAAPLIIPPSETSEADDAAEEARKKAADAYAELKKHIAEMEREALLSTLSANQKELEAIYDKYQKEIIAAKGHKAEIAKLERLRDAEYFATLEKQKQEEADKRNKAYQSFINDYEAFKEKEWEAGLTAREKEEVAVMQMYDSMAEKTMEALKNKVITQEQYDAIMQGLAMQQTEHMKALQQKFLAEDELAQTEHLNKLAEFEKKLANNPFVAGDPYEAERARINAHYDQLLADAQLFYEQKILDETEYQETIERIKKQKKLSEEELEKNAMKERIIATTEGYNAMGSSTLNLMNLLTAEQEKYTKKQKAQTILQLSMDTASAIGSLVKYSQANPLNAPTLGAAGVLTYAAGFLQIMTNVGMALKVLSSGTIPNASVNQKAEGGYTTVQGADDRENYRAKMLPKFENGFLNNPSLVLAGEKGTEYFVNNDMLQNPDVAQIVAGIEALSRGRISQVDFSQMLSMPAMQQKASGGYTSPSFSTASVTPVNNSNDTMLLMVAESLAKLNKHLDEGITSNAFIGDPTIIEFQKRQSYLSNIEKEAN